MRSLGSLDRAQFLPPPEIFSDVVSLVSQKLDQTWAFRITVYYSDLIRQKPQFDSVNAYHFSLHSIRGITSDYLSEEKSASLFGVTIYRGFV